MLTRALLLSGSTLLLAGTSAAQSRYFFSVNWHGPTVGSLDPLGTAITEGDILRPFNGTSMPELAPTSLPNISFTHTAPGLGLPGFCVGHPGGTPCVVEVDAFSRGGDKPFRPTMEIFPGDIMFSVDEFARGIPGGPAPNVHTEAMAREAAPDAFLNLEFMPPGPFSPYVARNVGAIDGDGLASASGYAYPGTGIKEPNTPFGGFPDTGDNKDAMDVVESLAPVSIAGPYYFSLDSSFFDSREAAPNSGSAVFNGFVGGDILRDGAGGAPTVWAPAWMLGLDLVGGPDSDDLDALILFENGDTIYQPSMSLYDWSAAGGPDMVVFSVRRGSAIIGMPDSILGIPIEPGDLLVPPVPGSGALPGIFVPAEALGLATARAGMANLGDDVTALDTIWTNLYDCDGDGIEDAVAIASGMVADTNQNGVPDSCETIVIGTPFCFCPTVVAPCGNASPTTGCINAVGTGALLTGLGSTSVTFDNLILQTTGLPPATFSLMFMATSTAPPVPLGNGLRCLAGTAYRFSVASTGVGTQNLGPGLAAYTVANNPAAGHLISGSTWNFQNVYRDIPGPCGSFINWSSGLSVTFTP